MSADRVLCRFLGLLHMEVFLQRLENEHKAKVISTPPTGRVLHTSLLYMHIQHGKRRVIG